MWAQLSRWLMFGGLALFLAGLLMAIGGKWGLGNLTGDLTWQKGGTSIYFPIVSCIVISVVLSIVLNILLRFFR